jgi:hypothetical protein
VHGRLCTSVSPTYFSGIGEFLIVNNTLFDMCSMFVAYYLNDSHAPTP